MNASRGILVAGNWKMNYGVKGTEAFFSQFKKLCDTQLNPEEKEMIQQGLLRICMIPSSVALEKAQSLRQEFDIPIQIAAQNAHWEYKGAFTGEISGPMLSELEVKFALVGHSERRQYFGESDSMIRKRASGLLSQGLRVILCLGETLEERNSNQTKDILTRQIYESVPKPNLPVDPKRLIIAYEPVWAIGTGLTASPEQAEEVHQFIRSLLSQRFSPEFSEQILILYGGSVTSENIESILDCPNCDGVLVGGASLNPSHFFQILKSAAQTILKSYSHLSSE